VLFGSEFLAKLEQLHLLAKKLATGNYRAERRSRQIGSSLEFADYREYAPGDELRAIDWPAYGRLGRLFVKLYEQERDLPVHFLIDASASMRWKSPQRLSKYDYTKQIAAALAYVALANLDAVNIHIFASDIHDALGLLRGKGTFHRVLNFLRGAPEPNEATNLQQCMHTFCQQQQKRGLVCILSDYFDPKGYEGALAMLRHAQFEVHSLQILDSQELHPDCTGDLRVMDVESNQRMDVTASPALLQRYQAEITAFNEALRAFCRRQSIAHMTITTDVPFEDAVLRTMREGFVLR
jgi:uncharacterized protein (DUF58 family)